MISQNEIQEINKIEGEVRGAVFHTDAKYILEIKGEDGLAKAEAGIKKLNQSISYGKDVKATGWYPLGWRILSLLSVKDIFGWSEEDIFKMGNSAPKYSFIVKTLLRYFVSLEKTFEESSKYWEEHYSVGRLEAPEINIEEKRLVLQLKDFKIHPVFCSYLKGYFMAIAKMVVRTEEMNIEESKCVFRGDDYDEFIVTWK